MPSPRKRSGDWQGEDANPERKQLRLRVLRLEGRLERVGGGVIGQVRALCAALADFALAGDGERRDHGEESEVRHISALAEIVPDWSVQKKFDQNG